MLNNKLEHVIDYILWYDNQKVLPKAKFMDVNVFLKMLVIFN